MYITKDREHITELKCLQEDFHADRDIDRSAESLLHVSYHTCLESLEAPGPNIY